METFETNTPSQNELITSNDVPKAAHELGAKAINVYQLPVHEEVIPVHSNENQGGRFNNGVVALENGRYNNGAESVETPNE